MSELTKTRRTEGLLAALLLFGPFLLAIPGPLGPLHRAFAAVELTGTGIIALAALPVAWLVVLRPSKRATLGWFRDAARCSGVSPLASVHVGSAP